MAKRSPPAETVDGDCIDPTLHPRRTMRLVGQDAALAIVARAVRGGRPPQAWLICGPPGVGKATLAYRIARYLLAHGATAYGAEDLSVPPNAVATVQIAAASHPGLLVLKRGTNPETGRPMSVLSVDEVRRLHGFFGLTAGAGGWRVALVDAADDMNEASANALLKLLEEPPSRAMLLVLANAPGRLLPTIRSRCQRLNLRTLCAADMEAELARAQPDMTNAERAGLVRLSGGSLGAALRLTDGDGLMLAKEADRLIEAAAAPDIAAIFALSEKIARIADGLPMLAEFLLQGLAGRIRGRALLGRPKMDCWVDALERIDRNAARSQALHLDPRQTLIGAVREMNAAVRRTGAL